MLSPKKSRPRPSRSVAISTHVSPVRKRLIAAVLAWFDRSEWITSTFTPFYDSRGDPTVVGELRVELPRALFALHEDEHRRLEALRETRGKTLLR